MKFLHSFFFLFFFSILFLKSSYSQLDSYTITRTAPSCGCFTNISGTGTAVSSWLNGTDADDNLSTNIPIGFNFVFDGGIQSNFRISTNGFITFNTSSPTNGANLPGCGSVEPYTYDNTVFSTSGRVGTLQTIAPFYNDLITNGFSLNTSMHYQVTGSAPNRILTIQWRGMANDVYGCDNDCSPSYGNLIFQVKLYETTNNIEFIYSTMTQSSFSCSSSGTCTLDNTYTSGINSSTLSGAPTLAQLITQQTANTATFNNTPKNNLTTLPSANSKITFTWNAPAAPGAVPPCAIINFPANASTNMCLNTYLSWGNNGGVPTGYDVYFGTAGSPPLVSANQTTMYYNPGALAANTTYNWKIVPKNGFGDASGCTTVSFSTGAGDVVPTSISSSAGTTFCVGTSSTISVVGGNRSAGSVWSWSAPFVLDFGCKVNPCYPLLGPWGNSSYTSTYNSAGTYKYYVFTRGCNGTTSCTSLTLTVLDKSNTTPTGVTSSAGNPICSGTNTTLTATGGTLGAGANNIWYSGSGCGGASIGSGTLNVTPGSTTTYSVRREGGTTCPNTTSCYDITITVETAVANNTVSATQTICSGQTPAVLSGSAPTGGNGTYTYVWESSITSGVAGFSSASGTNNSQGYSPGALTQTTWYRRKVTSGSCSTPSTSSSIQITVNPTPSAAGAITGTATVCQGQNGVAYSVGAISGAAGYNWVLPSGASISSGTNTNSITVNFSGSATAGSITVEGTNACGSGALSTFAIAINTASTIPTATASPPSVCSGSSSTLSISSGTLGTGASWNWFTGSCGGVLIGTGTSISVNPTSTITYYVRAQGTCNTTSCGSVTVTVPGNGGAGTWTWTGAVDNNWFNACNWDKGSVPDGLSDVIIPGGTAFNPLISGGIASCKTRTINVLNGGNLTINTSSGGKCMVLF